MANQPTIDNLHNCLVLDLLDSVPALDSDILLSAPYEGARGIRPGAGVTEVSALALLGSLFKKCKDEVSADAADTCLLAFLESNESCGHWEVPHSLSSPRQVKGGYLLDNPDYFGLREAKKRMFFDALKVEFLSIFNRPVPASLADIPGFDGSNPYSWDNVFLLGDVGPGAALEASGGSWFEKYYQSPLTATSEDLFHRYWATLRPNTARYSAENQRDHHYGHLVVNSGRYDSVPKSFKTERSIEIQPTVNMWVQKGIACILEHYVQAATGVSLGTQQFINRELAKRASVGGAMATIDLKEASNRIPLSLIRALLDGHELLDLIEKARVSYTELPWGDEVELKMCSTMGNGFTFILQTALFLASVAAVYKLNDLSFDRMPSVTVQQSHAKLVDLWSGRYEHGMDVLNAPPHFGILAKAMSQSLSNMTLPSWGVFGDDIILPTSCVPDLTFLIQEVIGGTVNTEKSFFSGDFRESCGADFYQGVEVRGVYASSLKTQQDRLSLLNRLVEWSAVHHVPLRRLCLSLWSSIPEKLRVPLHEDVTAGLRVPSYFAPSFPKTKAVRLEESNFQRQGRTYSKFEPKPKLLTYKGNQIAIFGLGILLSMLRGEMTSNMPVNLSESRSKAECLDILTYSLTVRQGQETLYDKVWRVSYDWDTPSSPMPSANDMEMSLRINVFR
jgi:hypothetical protein